MTREEAIEVIKAHCCFNSLIPSAKEALDIAIKALEQEGYYKDLAQSYERTIAKLTEAIAESHSDDCVSRQAVLDKIQSNWWSASLTEDAVKDLPSVTPTQKKGKWIFKDNSRDIWCSNCDASFEETPQDFNFCPNCGAEMESEK